MSEKKKKVIAVGDFIDSKNRIMNVAIPDPEEIGGTIEVTVLIRKPSPKDTIKIMEFVNKRFEGKADIIGKKMSDLDDEKRNEAFQLAFEYDATLISSSVYYPPDSGNPNDETEKVFESASEVMDRCPSDLFNALRMIVGQNRYVIAEGEAKK